MGMEPAALKPYGHVGKPRAARGHLHGIAIAVVKAQKRHLYRAGINGLVKLQSEK
jgi:hypothetical protein